MKKFFIYLPCIILVLVAFSQIYITQTNGLLTPAKGGGFGMFSTVDKLNNRIVTIYGVIKDKRVSIDINKKDPYFLDKINHSWQRARAFPTYSHLRDLAEDLGKVKLSKAPEYISIEVKKCVFDHEKGAIKYELVNDLTISYNRIK